MPYFPTLSRGSFFEFLLASLLIFAAVRYDRLGRRILALARGTAMSIGRNDTRLIALSAALPVVIRLLLLPIDPVPQPYDMEEFNHLLQADTYVLGRLANPVHPLAVMLQSYQNVEWPHYMSARPPLPAIFLFVGKALFKSAFVGNLIADALTMAALSWMLLGWVPRRWAAIGSLLSISTFGLFGYWVNSFWCPTTMALGGALLMGVVPRVEREPQVRWAAFFILGLVLLAGTRPYENAVYAGVICLWLAVRFLSRARREMLRKAAIRFALPVAVGAIAIVLAQLRYDIATTGNSHLMPYQIWRASQGVTPMFLWQPITGEPVFYNASAAEFSRWNTKVVTAITQGGLFGAVLLAGRQAVTFRDLLGPFLFLPFLCFSPAWFPSRLKSMSLVVAFWVIFFLLFVAWGWAAAIINACVVVVLLLRWRNPDERLPVLLIAVGLLATSLPTYYMNVYFAAYTAPMMIIVLKGVRALSISTRRIGPSLAGFLLLGSAALPATEAAALVAGNPILGASQSHFDQRLYNPRRDVTDIVSRFPGDHAIFVRTDAGEPIDPVWLDPVWNAADVDGQRIVWLRDLKAAWTSAAQQYYRGRQFWLMLMEKSGYYTLTPYPSASLPPASPLSALPMPDREVARALGARER